MTRPTTYLEAAKAALAGGARCTDCKEGQEKPIETIAEKDADVTTTADDDTSAGPSLPVSLCSSPEAEIRLPMSVEPEEATEEGSTKPKLRTTAKPFVPLFEKLGLDNLPRVPPGLQKPLSAEAKAFVPRSPSATTASPCSPDQAGLSVFGTPLMAAPCLGNLWVQPPLLENRDAAPSPKSSSRITVSLVAGILANDDSGVQ